MKDLLNLEINPELAKPGIRYFVTAMEYFILISSYNMLRASNVPVSAIGLIYPVLWIVYFPVAEGIFGQTIGKRLANIKVVRSDYSKINILQSFVRRLCDVIDFLPMFGLLGIVIGSSTRNSQRIGDMAAGTLVVKV